jgi:hypothetical protein
MFTLRRHSGSRPLSGGPTPNDACMRTPDQPPRGTRGRLALALVTGLPVVQTWALTSGGFAIDIQDRFLVRAFYNSAYAAAVGAAPTWNGSVTGCNPGTTDAAFRELVLLRINYFRAMAGVPATVTFDPGYNGQAQAAALMMSANGTLNHTPPSSWTCWTQVGSDAAGKSNLSLGSVGPDAVARQMRDDGSNNGAAGHRRWLLYPQTRVMGTGDIPANGAAPAVNALFILDGRYGENRPATREAFVAWPPPGYVPYQIVYPRWSFSYAGADFSAATVQMRQGGTTIATTSGAPTQYVGENTLVWVPQGRDPSGTADAWVAPTADTAYDVTITNVRIGAQTRSFTYTVIVMDPGQPGVNDVVPRVSGPVDVFAGRATHYGILAVPRAVGYQLSTLDLATHVRVDGAEPGTLGGIIDGTDATYALVSTGAHASGTASFHLAQPAATPQYFALKDRFLVGTGASWQFKIRLGWATSNQVARAQVSVDDGRTWQDLYTQAGSGGAGAAAFTARTVNLNAFAGQIVNLRFLYDLGVGQYYPQTQDGVGLYVDDIAVGGVERVAAEDLLDLNGPDFSATASAAGRRGYRARARLWDGLPPLTWGPVTRVTIVPAPSDQTLGVTLMGTGSGRVTSIPSGIDCGSICEQVFPGAAPVTLSAVAVDGSAFNGWGGACTGTGDCVVPMDKSYTLIATFGRITVDDSDGDLMPDQWERDHGLDPGTSDGNQDPDRDGADNLLEYRGGSDPQDAADLPAALILPARGGWRAILR